MRFCTSCGHRNAADNAFCEACGAALRAREGATAPAVTVTSAAGKRTLAIAGMAIAVLLAAGTGAWFLLAPPAASERSLPVQAQTEDAAASTPGWWSRLKDYFAATVGGNPLIGKWETNMLGVIMLQYEFTADSMRVGDAVTPVRYEVKEGEVVVYPEGQAAGLIVRMIDQDTVELDVGVAALKFKRVK